MGIEKGPFEALSELPDEFEPRVKLIDVIALPGFDNNAFDVTIKYEVVGADVPPQQLEFALQPTR